MLFVLCVKIFFARIADVTLGTIRTNYSVRGKTMLAGLIGFFEVFIWFLVVKEALNSEINSIWIVTGTILGTFISNTLVNSLISVEVMTKETSRESIDKIRKEGFGVSVVETVNTYNEEEANILFITLNSRNLNKLKRIIREIDEKAFVVINETKVVQNGYIK